MALNATRQRELLRESWPRVPAPEPAPEYPSRHPACRACGCVVMAGKCINCGELQERRRPRFARLRTLVAERKRTSATLIFSRDPVEEIANGLAAQRAADAEYAERLRLGGY